MTRIVAIGEAMVELAPAGDAELYRAGFAGDTLNTAWYLRQLMPATDAIAYFTAIGKDDISARLLAFIRAAGLETGQIAQRDDSTVGLYMISLNNGERSFSYWRGQSAARRMLEDDTALRAALQGQIWPICRGSRWRSCPKTPAGACSMCCAIFAKQGVRSPLTPTCARVFGLIPRR